MWNIENIERFCLLFSLNSNHETSLQEMKNKIKSSVGINNIWLKTIQIPIFLARDLSREDFLEIILAGWI